MLPQGIVLLDPEGRYVLWNKQYAEIYSKTADLFEEGARLEDTLRVGVARGDYPEAAGHEDEWIAARLEKLPGGGQAPRADAVRRPRHHDRGTPAPTMAAWSACASTSPN